MCKITFICQKRKGYAEGNIRARIKWGDNLLFHSIGINWRADRFKLGTPRGSNAEGLTAAQALAAMEDYAKRVSALVTPTTTPQQLRERLSRQAAAPASAISHIVEMYISERALADNSVRSLRDLAKRMNATMGDELTTANIAGYLNTRRNTLSATSFNLELTQLRALISWATSAEMISGVEVNATNQKVPRNEVLHLTPAELRAIESAQLPDELHAERSRFLLQCLTGLRASDIARISSESIVGDNLTMRLRKTAEVVTIPLNERTKRLALSLIGVACPSTPLRDKQIKRICALSGIDTLVTRAKRIGGNLIEVTQPKWCYIGTHTARRSFICNLIAVGVSSDVIMSMTGHRSYASMRPYIGVTTDTKRKALELLAN